MTASNQSRQVQQTIGSGQQQVTKTIIIQQQAPGQPQTIQLQTPPKVFLCYSCIITHVLIDFAQICN